LAGHIPCTATGAAIQRSSDIKFNIGRKHLMHSFNISGQLKSFTLFPKLHRSWNVRVISNQPVPEMTLGDLSYSYHGSEVMRDLAHNMIKHHKNKLNVIYVYHHKHNYILCSMFTITKAQLHVSAIFRLYMRNLSISYTNVCRKFTVCGMGWVRDLILSWRKGCGLGLFRELC